MPPIREPLDDGEAARLAAYLMAEEAPKDRMPAAMCEGFLTAIVTCPLRVAQSKWLRMVMGEQSEDPTVAEFLKTQEVLPLLIRWHDAIAWQLHDDLERYAPSCIREPGGGTNTTLALQWAAGYFKGVKLHSRAWEPLIRDGQRIRKIKVLALSWQKPPTNMSLLVPAVEGFVPDIAEAYRYMKTRK